MDNNKLRIDYEATTDKPTIVNLSNHSYFNLARHDAGKDALYAHKMMINADAFTPVDENLITTGEIQPVKGTPMDFTSPKEIGLDIDDSYQQLQFGGGYDHNWVLNKEKERELSLAVRVAEPTSGRVMEIYTTEPGLQFYSGNFMDGIPGKDGANHPWRSAIVLETQHYPDSPNHPNFPSVVLRPGQKYQSTTIYKFSLK
jgi:aldose 1-epimerase